MIRKQMIAGLQHRNKPDVYYLGVLVPADAETAAQLQADGETIARLEAALIITTRNMHLRDDFIVDRGVWQEFADGLPKGDAT